MTAQASNTIHKLKARLAPGQTRPMTTPSRTRRQGKHARGRNATLSLLFVPHRGTPRTLRFTHWQALVRTSALVCCLLLAAGIAHTVRTTRENVSLRAAYEQEKALRVEETANLSRQIAEQASLLADTATSVDAVKAGNAQADKAVTNFEAEYENLLVAYIDKNLQGVKASRGENGNASFREDVKTLKALLETVEEATLDARSKESELAVKTAALASYLRSLPSAWPTVPDATVASDFGRRLHPVYRYYRKHEGLDIGNRKGDPIYASGSGTVTMAEWHSGYGNLVEIDHGNGYVTRYGHCSKLLVKVGQRVDQGEKIALIGSTGTSTGPHVHFEVRINGTPVDPIPFITD